jgi:hypothetical protein
VLRISTGVKRPARVELSSVQTRKQAKMSKALPSIPTSVHKAAAPSRPTSESDDDRVAACSMLDVVSVASSLSSSSSESSTLDSIPASPPPIPDLVIPSELPDIPKMRELEAAQ